MGLIISNPTTITPPNNQEKLIPLNHGKFAIVDAEDYDDLSQWKWGITAIKYCARSLNKEESQKKYGSAGKYGRLFMHRHIMNPPEGVFIDHINGNGLDNRKSNLRLCNNSQNMSNIGKRKGSSRYKGVSINRKGNCWQAHIMKNYKSISLGQFKNEMDAALAYNEAAKKYHGEFAHLNIIKENYHG